MTIALEGISASKGIAIGRVHVVERGQPEIHERTLRPRDVEKEVERFNHALDQARQELLLVKEKVSPDVASDAGAFIDTHLLMLEDSTLSKVPITLIRERRCNAAWALKLQRDEVVSVFESMEDPYLRTRKDDVDQVVGRVQRFLAQVKRRKRRIDGGLAGRIIFAEDQTPADTVLMHHQGVAALLTEFGGPNSHTAILARSLRIPAVVGLHRAHDYLREDELVVIDGRHGLVLLDASEEIVRQYQRLERDIERHHLARRKLRHKAVVSTDGQQVRLQANVELPSDVEAVTQVGAQGVGLYRTEFLFMNREQPPDEEEQLEAYRSLVDALNGAPLTIRTLDLGADKQVDGGRPGAPMGANPALGLRAVRLCLKDPGLFRPQLRAILRASAHGSVRMMIPMLSNAQELSQVQQIVGECRAELAREGLPFDAGMPMGAMIEVPAAALCADFFARRLDFLSIGTNDLIQYTIAIDRINDEVNYLYDPLHPAVLRLIQMTIRAGEKAKIPVAMCGEMAGDTRYTRLLLGMGLKEFSVHPNALLEIKQVINGSHVEKLRKLSQRVMRTTRPSSRAAILDEILHSDATTLH